MSKIKELLSLIEQLKLQIEVKDGQITYYRNEIIRLEIALERTE